MYSRSSTAQFANKELTNNVECRLFFIGHFLIVFFWSATSTRLRQICTVSKGIYTYSIHFFGKRIYRDKLCSILLAVYTEHSLKEMILYAVFCCQEVRAGP